MNSTFRRRINRFLSESLNRLLFIAARLENPFRAQPSEKRLLLVRADSIGDFLLFTPCLQHYRSMFPDYRITLVVSSGVTGLAQSCPFVDEVWSLDWKTVRTSLSERIQWQRKIISKGFIVAINTVYSPTYHFSEALIGWSMAARRIAFSCKESGREKRDGYRPYYSELISDVPHPLFEIERNFTLLRYLGYAGSGDSQTMVWESPDDERSAAEKANMTAGRPYAVVFPGAQSRVRRWGARRFVAVIREICTSYPMVYVVCGDKYEARLCGAICECLQSEGIQAVSLAGMTTLREAASLLRNAVYCLGNESSGVHLAAAVHTPAVCIQGGGHYGRFYPYPGNPLTVAVTNEIECFHCDWSCSQERASCIEDISVEQVVTALDNLLSDQRDRS